MGSLRAEISNFEYSAVGELLRAHLALYGQRLKAMVLFGELVTAGRGYDIQLVEIVEDWDGPIFWEFPSTKDLPLRGLLQIYFLRPEWFDWRDVWEQTEDNQILGDIFEGRRSSFGEADRNQVSQVLRQLREGFEVVYEAEGGLVKALLSRNPNQPASGESPLTIRETGS